MPVIRNADIKPFDLMRRPRGTGQCRPRRNASRCRSGDVLIVPSFLPHQLFGGDGATLECMAVMQIGSRAFLPNGEELHPPWAE
jgi:hypothetical protein